MRVGWGGEPFLCIFDYMWRLKPFPLLAQLSCLPIDWWSIDYPLLFVYFKGILYLSNTLKLTLHPESWITTQLLTHSQNVCMHLFVYDEVSYKPLSIWFPYGATRDWIAVQLWCFCYLMQSLILADSFPRFLTSNCYSLMCKTFWYGKTRSHQYWMGITWRHITICHLFIWLSGWLSVLHHKGVTVILLK